MDNAAAGGHPLHIAGSDGGVIADAVAMLHRSSQHVGNRCNAAVRMPRKAFQVFCRQVVANIVEQQKGIEIRRVAETERAPQMYASTLHGRFGLDQAFYGSNGHGHLRLTPSNLARFANLLSRPVPVIEFGPFARRQALRRGSDAKEKVLDTCRTIPVASAARGFTRCSRCGGAS